MAKKDVVISLILLTIGLTSTRAKFYGEYVFILYLLFFYVPGSLKKMKISHLIIALVSLCLILVVAWNKIDYYFISGGEVDMAFDEDLLSSFARPVIKILKDSEGNDVKDDIVKNLTEQLTIFITDTIED